MSSFASTGSAMTSSRPGRAASRALILCSLLAAGPAALAASPAPEPVRTDYDMGEIAKPPRLSERALHGRTLFVKYCALCHDPVSQPTPAIYGPPLNAELIQGIGDDTVRKQVLEGTPRMPGFQYLLGVADVEDLLTFLKTYTGQPAPATLARVARPPAPGGADATLNGEVRLTGGAPLAGVAVSARAAGRTITTTVFTDAAGRFAFPVLPPGDYQLRAQAEGWRATESSAALSPAGHARLRLTMAKLTHPEDVAPQLSSGEWLDSLPAQTAEDRHMKEIFRLNCGECHALSVPLQRRFDEKGWTAIIDLMRQMDYDGWYGPPDPAHPGFGATVALSEMNRHYEADLVKYLARVRGPHSTPIQPKLVSRPIGAAARVVITAYDIPPVRTPNEPVWHDGTLWSDGAASGMHGAIGVHDVLIDRNGNAWIAQTSFPDIRQLLKLDTASGQVSAFNFPATDRTGILSVRTHGLGLDSKGFVWFGIDQRLARIDPANDSFQQYTPPAAIIDHMGNLGSDVDGKGKIWAEGLPGIMRFDPQSGEFTWYDNEHPTPLFFFSYGIAGDAEGNGWWTLAVANLVEMADPRTGKTTEFLMRPPWIAEDEAVATQADRAFHVPIEGGLQWGGYQPGFQYPRRLAADKNGSVVWVPNYWGRNLARIDIHTKAVTYYRLPVDVHPYFVDVDRKHMVWIASQSDDRVLSFDPQSERWTVYRLPINGCESRNINVDKQTGDVWVPCYRASKVFRLQARDKVATTS